ncbi:MAG: dehydrogenase [Chloroflexi bacterium]|nr:MAG: dehydrogenase [Chloroflexota bacterium]
MSTKFRWGILAPGNIARKFVTGVQALADHEVIAVGSRDQARADAFADEFGIRNRHASYEALAADPEVDAIYVATPHPMHKENTLTSLRAGKHVLCEKPFTINAAEAQVIINEARERKLFLMEAMWTRFIPLMAEVRRLIADGAIGKVRMVSADFGYRAGFRPESRAFDLALGGGALLDVGVYPISLASMLLGTPDRITGLADLGQTGVDEQSAFILGYPGGELAILYTAVRTSTPQEAIIMGENGMIRIHPPFWIPNKMTLTIAGRGAQEVEIPYEANGYNYEAAEVANCVRAGKLESDIMTLDESLSIMQTMDAIRAQWRMKYPME